MTPHPTLSTSTMLQPGRHWLRRLVRRVWPWEYGTLRCEDGEKFRARRHTVSWRVQLHFWDWMDATPEASKRFKPNVKGLAPPTGGAAPTAGLGL